MLKTRNLKTFARKAFLAILYSSALFLSVQVPMSAMNQTLSNDQQPVYQRQSVNILPFQEQDSKHFNKPVSLLPVIILPVSGLFNSVVPRIAPISALFSNHSFGNLHSPISLEIAYRNLRI